jgi:hypothetical protein
MKSFKQYLVEANLNPEQQQAIAPYLKKDADGSQYYDLPPTDPKEIGARMGTSITSPEALAQIKSPQGQQEIIQHLLAMTNPKNAPPTISSTSTPLSDADAAALVPQNDDAELARWRKIAGLR